MTLEELIDHEEKESKATWNGKPTLCADEHRQLAEWLKDYKRLLKQPRWIPCSERLPEENADVICCTNAEEVFVASYLGKRDDGSECFDDDNGMMWEGDVIAWMPWTLPEPYKVDPQESEDKK